MIGPLGENLVFLLGVPRSGTTLLSAMLDGHPAILCPPEPWIMLALSALGQTHPSHPADPQLLGDAARGFCQGPAADEAIRAFVRALLNRKLADAGRTVFVEKTPRNFLILPMIRRVFPKARYLWLSRNPLDVAASYLSSWKVDIARQLVDFPRHRACIDFVVGFRRLAEFASGNDCIYSLRYEEVARQPSEAIAGAIEFFGLPAAAGLAEQNLAASPLAASQFGDQNLRNTDRPHQRSIDSWQRILSDKQLQILLDAIGAELFDGLGYSHTLRQLGDRGLSPRGAEMTATIVGRVEAGLAERLAEVHAGSTLQSGDVDESAVLLGVADLQPSAISALLAELAHSRTELPRIKAWAESLQVRLGREEMLADKAEHLEAAMATVRQQNAELHADLNVARNEALAMKSAKEQLERPGALFLQEFRRLKQLTRRLVGQRDDS